MKCRSSIGCTCAESLGVPVATRKTSTTTTDQRARRPSVRAACAILLLSGLLPLCFGQACYVQPLPLAAPIVDEPGAPGGAVDPSTTGPQTPDSGPTPQVVANAGGDLTVTEGEEAVLDGSQSSGPAGTPLSFQWQQVDGPPVELIDATSSQARFTAPDVEADTTLTFSLNVSAGGASATAACRVTVVNQLDPASTEPQVQPELAITASPSPAEGPAPLQEAFTAGTLNGQPLSDGTYTWDFGDNTVSQGRNVSHVFANAGTYVVTLCLAVGTGASGPMSCTEVTVKVNDAQRPTGGGGAPPAPISSPVVSDQEVDAEEDAAATLTLQGSDPANGDLTFVVVSAPAHGTLGAIDNTAQASGSVAYTPEAGFSGTDTFTFKAHNGTNESNVATFTVKVKPKAGALAVSPAGALVSTGTLGGPFAPASITYTLSNTGRSAIDWTAGKTKTWVTLSKAGGNLAAGATDTVVVSINSGATSLAADSYTDTVTFTNTTNGNGSTTRQVSLAVGLPPPGVLSVSPAGGLSSSGSQGGPFNPASITYTLSNTGGSSVNWTVAKTQAWVTSSKTSGTLAGGATDTVVVSLNAAANGLANGLYGDTITFTNTTNGSGNTTRSVSLTVGGFPISGTVTRIIAGGGTAPVAGLGLTFTGSGASAGQNFTATTAADGTYTALAPVGWTGSSAAADPDNWRLTPANRSYTNVQAAQPAQDFTAARNYYVTTTGADTSPGTKASPFRTIQKAAGVLLPGDTCIVAAGTYNETVTATHGGATGAPVTFIAAATDTVVLDGGHSLNYGFYVLNQSYVTMQGFQIQNYASHGVFINDVGNSNIVRMCTIHDCQGNGITNRGGDDCIIEYNEIYNCTIGIRTDWRDTTQNFVQRGLIGHNLCHDNSLDPPNSDGIAGAAAKDVVFEYNICWQNADDGIDVSSSGGGGNVPERCVIRYNVAFRNGYPVLTGDGNGIKVSTNAGGAHILHHNISFANRRSGFDNDQEGNWGSNQYYNNTGYGNGANGLTLDMPGVTSPDSAAVVKNSVFTNDDRLGLGLADFGVGGTYAIKDSDYNFIGDGRFPTAEGTHSLPASGTPGDPRFANPEGAIDVNYAGGDGIAGKWRFIWDQVQANFALRSDSPCRDVGVELPGITDGFVGAAPDIGAVEFLPSN